MLLCKCPLATECDTCLEAVRKNVARRVQAVGAVRMSTLNDMVADIRPGSEVVQRFLAKEACARLVVVGNEVRSPLYHATALLSVAWEPVPLYAWVADLGLSANVAAEIRYRPGPAVFVFRGANKQWYARARTALSAHNLPSLIQSIERRGICGTPLEEIYSEYTKAHIDVHTSSEFYIAHNTVWHISVACSLQERHI